MNICQTCKVEFKGKYRDSLYCSKHCQIKGMIAGSLKAREERPKFEIDPITSCWNALRAPSDKYGHTKIKIPGLRRKYLHVWMWEQKNGKLVPEGLELDHTCKNPRCCNPDHLEPVTNQINVYRGKSTKLSTEQVVEIRQLAITGLTHKEIAQKFNTDRSNVSGIIAGKFRKVM